MPVETRIEDLFEKDMMTYLIGINGKRKTICGLDGIYPSGLGKFWNEHGETIKQLILSGKYVPVPAEKVMIAKPGSKKKRELKIYCVVDRMIMHGINIILNPYFDKMFSNSSFGFRPGKGCFRALMYAIGIMSSGYDYTISVDLESFFDTIDHGIMLNLLTEHIEDKRLLKLIMSYVKIKVISNRKNIYKNYIGVPQGGATSPLLANIYLNEFDKKMDSLGYRFVRYADDIVLFARNEQEKAEIYAEAEKILIGDLKLRINQEKTVTEKERLLYLGYEIKKNETGRYQFFVSEKKTVKMFEKVLSHLKKGLPDEEWLERLGSFNRGWLNYYVFSDNEDTGRIAEEADKYENRYIKERGLIPKSRGYISMTKWWIILIQQKNPEVKHEYL